MGSQSENSLISTRQIMSSVVPESVLEHYDRLSSQVKCVENWTKKTEEDIWHEMCFCILSGNVSYELAKSCFNILKQKDVLNPEWILKNKKSFRALSSILNSPIFEPKKKDGSFRKYRFPKSRAKQIVKAAYFIYSKNKSVKTILQRFSSDIEARNYLAFNISGLGIKEASHFLRNIGYSDSLAILDVHMLEFLKQRAFIQLAHGSAITKNVYLKIETILRNFVSFHRLNLAIFDLAVWYYMRNIK